MHYAIGTCRREAAFKKISGSGLLFTTSSPQTEASIYWSMPDCFQYPSATRRVVEVATATKAARELNFTLTEEHLSQMRGSALPRSRKLFEEWFHGKGDIR